MTSATAGGQPQQVGRCYLLDLPPELRVRIYEFVFNQQIFIMLSHDPKGLTDVESWDKNPSALIKTCKTTHKEAKPVLYKQVSLQIDIEPCDHHRSAIFKKRFMGKSRRFVRRYLRQIQHMTVRVNSFINIRELNYLVDQVEAIDEGIQEAIEKVVDEDLDLASVEGCFDPYPCSAPKEEHNAFEKICREKTGNVEAEGPRSVAILLLWKTLLQSAHRTCKEEVLSYARRTASSIRFENLPPRV